MAELSKVEKVLMDQFGWEDRGDGTLLSSAGKVYDHEAGSTFEERHALGTDYAPATPTPAPDLIPEPVDLVSGSVPEGTSTSPDLTDVTPTGAMSGDEITGSMLYGENAAKEAGAPVIRDIGTGAQDDMALIYFPDGSVVKVQKGFGEAYLNHAKNTGVTINSKDDYNKFTGDISSKSTDPFSIEAAVSKLGGDLTISYRDAKKGKTIEELLAESNQYNADNLLSIRDTGTAVAAPKPANFDEQMAAINAAIDLGDYERAQELYNALISGASIPDPTPTPIPTPTPDAVTTPAPNVASTTGTTTPSVEGPNTITNIAPPQEATFTAPAAPVETVAAPFASTTMGTPFAPITGTFTKPATTSMITNMPSSQYIVGGTGTTTTPTTTPSYSDVRMYRNDAGMTSSITFVNGQPSTPIPSGFYPVGSQPRGQTPYTPMVNTVPAPTVTPVTPYTPKFMAQGGIVPELPKPSGKKFGGFKPEAQERIAQSLGYTGDMQKFDKFLEENPEKKEEMDKYTETAKQMAEGGVVLKAQNGVDVTGAVDSGNATTVSLQQYDPRVINQQYIPQQANLAPATYTGEITNVMSDLARTPALPLGSTVVPLGTQLEQGQIVSPYSGQVSGTMALPTGLAATEQSMMPIQTPTTMMSPIEASGAIRATADQTQAAQLQQVAQINAAQNVGTSVANVEAAQGTGILMNNPVQRKIESDPVTGESELISGVANAETAAKFNEEIQAATATPTKQATVAGQLEGLMAQFEGGNTPAWAAGSMRTATATMAARGLGASSMAGQAIIQAAMEAALPIAQMDAQVTAQFEQQNLSNRQQRAILAAQQRAQFMGMEFDQGFQARVANAAKISDIANMNFTAEQQVALENSRVANTMELSNLSNSQAMVMAEAAALANMDMSNLNNRQQAAVQNAQNFLQADLTNLNNKQSTELFKAQQRIQSLFTDQAALNAAQQFNATSQNQTDQFFAQLQTNTAQFNASQANAQAQFNAGQVNVIERFNAEINNQRDQFNASNRLVIDQANAQWRRQIATADTAAVNRANEINAQALLGYSQSAYNNLWQFYADNMEWAWTSAENERGRISAQAIAQLKAEASMSIAEFKADAESSAGIGGFIGDLLTSDLSKSVAGSVLGDFGFFPTFG